MALGGGRFTSQDKVLPGSYINFVSASSANAGLSERGIATMPLLLDWGPEETIFAVSSEEFEKDSPKFFGYAYKSSQLKALRDLFLGTRLLYAYRLNGGGKKAACSGVTARYSGERGNAIRIVIRVNADNASRFDVMTYLDTELVDEQTVSNTSELKENDFVVFGSEFTLEATAGMALSGGTNGEVTGDSYQNYLDKAESYTFNTMGAAVTDNATKKLFAAFNKRLRDEMGIKFQLVLYDYPDADYMGIISVKNKCIDGMVKEEEEIRYPEEASLVYWVIGAEAGCAVNKSCQNMIYDGEYTVDADYTQTDLVNTMKSGEFVLHKVNEEIRVLADINTMVTTTDTCGDIFKENQTMRVIDQLANDDAVLFNTKYLGVVPNDESGRVSLWSDLVKNRQKLQDIRAIENFSDSDVVVEQGKDKKSVVVNGSVTIVNAMAQLYMTVTVS